MKKNPLQLVVATALLLLSSMTVFAQKADDVVGVWLTAEEESHIEIFKKSDGKYYGKIVWLKEPNEEDGSAKLDDDNPDESLRSRPIMGMELLTGFEFDDDDMWEDGKIYDPKEGKTYSCQMEFDGNVLEVRGYIGFSLIGRTTRWTRVK